MKAIDQLQARENKKCRSWKIPKQLGEKYKKKIT